MPKGSVKKQMPLALDEAMKDQLRAASERNGRSIADEIRVRVALSFEEESHDPFARSLADAVIWCAEDIGRTAPWWKSRKAHQALSVAIQTILADEAPAPDAPDSFGGDDPDSVGRQVARHYQRYIGHIMEHAELIKRGELPPPMKSTGDKS